MSRRVKLILICAVSTLSVLLLTATQHRPIADISKTINPIQTVSKTINPIQKVIINDVIQWNQTNTIDYVIQLQRIKIQDEMKYFEYPSGRFGVDAEKLADLTPETGGTPVRSIIMTTWRSGSSFLGEILNAMPGNYYHFEPLQPFGGIRIRGPPNDKKAIGYLKKLLKCDYSDMEEYLKFGEKYFALFYRNPLMMRQCQENPQFCTKIEFLTPFCKLFPLQSMKIIRLNLALAEQILDDTSLNVRILLLVRDPRGTMQSRKHCKWCDPAVECRNATYLCNDLISDFYAAQILIKKYPSRFRVVRYEDLSMNSYDMTQDILEFYGLPFDHRIEEFLDTHTKNNSGDVLSTFRDSKSTPFHWITDLEWYEIEEIQKTCGKSMDLWGYRKMNSSKELDETFDPVLPAPFT